MFAPLAKDFYKVGHKDQYPEGTEFIYSNFTARSGELSNVKDSKGVYFIGLQYFIKSFLIEKWNDSFFNKPKDEVVEKYKRIVSIALGYDVDCSHIEALHDLGHLPVKIKALPEGSFVPYGVPMLTIINTLSEFYWVTNMLETQLSAELWLPITSATTYKAFEANSLKYSRLTCDNDTFVPFQNHDFSMRGMQGCEAATLSGLAFILAGSKGTDCIPAILAIEDYYNGTDFIAGSVNATEHSVMCAGGNDDEVGTFKRLLTEVYPSGILSVVSDSWDFWKVVTEYLPQLKDVIMNRDGKLVVRPDSGNPVDILCGKSSKIVKIQADTFKDFSAKALNYLETKVRDETPHGEEGNWEPTGVFEWNDKFYNVEVYINWNRHDKQFYYVEDSSLTSVEEITIHRTPEQKGLIECLWETFGGTINSKGFKELDTHIGLIYGDSITLERQEEILRRLANKGFASNNIVFGVGSYTLGYVTRDTHGMAMKSTYAVINGQGKVLQKDPKTDSGSKKSAKGLLMVSWENGKYVLNDDVDTKQEKHGCLEVVFENGKLIREVSYPIFQ